MARLKKYRRPKSEILPPKKRRFSKEAILTLAISFLMIGSVMGFLWKGGGQRIKYNEIWFTQKEDGFYTKIDGKEVRFDFFPAQIENISTSPGIADLIKDKNMVYITLDPNGKYLEDAARAQYSLSNTLWQFLSIYPEIAFTNETEYNVSVITCQDATEAIPVIELREGNNTEIYSEDNCIILEARSGFDFSMLKDRLLYSIFGIIGD